jgi:membrane fusion protein (multidrug efflux system)
MNKSAGRQNVVLALVICLIVLLAIGGSLYYTLKKKKPKRGPRPPRKSIAIETVIVNPRTLESKISAVGTVLSNESVTIKPEVAGIINTIGFEEGNKVEEGKILFTLDTDLLKAEYEEVEANYNFAASVFERAKKLKEDGVIPSEEFDDRLRAYLNAKSRLNTLSTRLKKHSIKAPFHGTLGSRTVSIGDYVGVGESLVNLEDLSQVKVEFFVPQRFINRLSQGQLVRVSIGSLSQFYEGTIYLIEPKLDPETRSALVKAKIPNPENVLKPGMFCTVTIVIKTIENALAVPLEARVSRGEKHFLYVVEEDKAVMREVQLGIFAEGSIEITEGLNPGDRVIVAGLQKIVPGAFVQEAGDISTNQESPAYTLESARSGNTLDKKK